MFIARDVFFFFFLLSVSIECAGGTQIDQDQNWRGSNIRPRLHDWAIPCFQGIISLVKTEDSSCFKNSVA